MASMCRPTGLEGCGVHAQATGIAWVVFRNPFGWELVTCLWGERRRGRKTGGRDEGRIAVKEREAAVACKVGMFPAWLRVMKKGRGASRGFCSQASFPGLSQISFVVHCFFLFLCPSHLVSSVCFLSPFFIFCFFPSYRIWVGGNRTSPRFIY